MVLELLHPGFRLFTLLATALLCGSLLLTLLVNEEHTFMLKNVMKNLHFEMKLRLLPSPELGLVLKMLG